MVSKWQSWRFCVGLSSGRKERRIMGLEVHVQSDCSFYRAIAKSPRDSDNLVWRCEDAARGKILRRNFRRKDSPLRFSRTITSGPCEQHEPSFFGSIIMAWEESLVVFVFRTAPNTNFARLDAVQETEESPRKERLFRRMSRRTSLLPDWEQRTRHGGSAIFFKDHVP